MDLCSQIWWQIQGEVCCQRIYTSPRDRLQRNLFTGSKIWINSISTHTHSTPRLGNRGYGCQIGKPTWSAWGRNLHGTTRRLHSIRRRKQSVDRVSCGYTMGNVLSHCTLTHVYHTCDGYGYYPTHNYCGFFMRGSKIVYQTTKYQYLTSYSMSSTSESNDSLFHFEFVLTATSVEMEYREILFRLETERSDKELYRIIAQSRPVQMISY